MVRSCYWRKIINYISEKPVGDVGEGEVVIGNQILYREVVIGGQ